jgi:hypothetical protein
LAALLEVIAGHSDGDARGQSRAGAYFDAMTPGPDVLSGSAQWWDETGKYELRQTLHWLPR